MALERAEVAETSRQFECQELRHRVLNLEARNQEWEDRFACLERTAVKTGKVVLGPFAQVFCESDSGYSSDSESSNVRNNSMASSIEA